MSPISDIKYIKISKHAWQFFLSWQDYYPERLRRMFIVHAPFVFMAIWKLVCPFIDSNTKKKVNFWICKCDDAINFSTLFCHAIISTISECSIHTSHWYKTLGLYIYFILLVSLQIVFVENKMLKLTLLEEIDGSQLPEIYGGKLPLVPI